MAFELRQGDAARGREHVVTARTMYRSMGMRYWLEQLEGEVAAMY